MKLDREGSNWTQDGAKDGSSSVSLYTTIVQFDFFILNNLSLTTAVDSVGDYQVSDGIFMPEVDHQPVRTTGPIVGVWHRVDQSIHSLACSA